MRSEIESESRAKALRKSCDRTIRKGGIERRGGSGWGNHTNSWLDASASVIALFRAYLLVVAKRLLANLLDGNGSRTVL